MILVIDNYDSFTYNIVGHLQTRKKEVKVIRNDDENVEKILAYKPELLILSPGPKSPREAGICIDLVQAVARMEKPIPIFGVCLGCQVLAAAFGSSIVRANLLFHGKVSTITHDGTAAFKNLTSPMVQARYHSLVIEAASLSDDYRITAKSEDDEIMGIKHKTLPFEGVQFHPESIASVDGTCILDNAVEQVGRAEQVEQAGLDKRAGQAEAEVNALRVSIDILLEGKSLTRDEARASMDSISNGNASTEEMVMFLTAMRLKKETATELAGIALSARDHAVPFPMSQSIDFLCDIVGTGGDSKNMINVSTTAGIVAAGAGARVAKHGNRAVSSSCGSADVLEALGVDITLSKERMTSMVEEAGMGFLFAPLYHPAMKHVVPVRKKMKTRTLFNILGPLVNPAHVPSIVLGVYDESLLDLMANALLEMKIEKAIVVHSHDGSDELSVQFPSELVEITGSKVTRYTLDPNDYGFHYDQNKIYAGLEGKGAPENAEKILRILRGTEKGIAHDTMVLNAGCLLYVCGKAQTLVDGIELAKNSIETLKALHCLEKMKQLSKAT